MNGCKSNFWAKYTYGNKAVARGIKNYHLNIRSLINKVTEFKYVIKQHSPHILGLSECELKKPINEDLLKIPGYKILFPKSWSQVGYATVVVYIKSSLSYEQLHDYEEANIQSIWIKGGFQKGKKLLFGHCYCEHTSTLGNSLASQRNYLERLLNQWKTVYHEQDSKFGVEPEFHIMGDMNVDAH